ncbi:MAG TPA: general stress protein [Salinimicrobium catena]|uniref:General stress protein n=1 Tax=Salinimicrobium catena TaxID=390640 RepID=A0A7C2R4C3_9FLAO|nr:general stress protein [Salinimicrobium catena]
MSTENLNKEESIKKLKEHIDDNAVAMMITGFDKKPISAVPMYTKKMDKDGSIWFLSGRNSEHNKDLIKNNDVQLLYSNPDDMEFVSVYGEAEVTSKADVIEELYSSTDNNYFKGKDDPEVTAIKVRPQEAYYWDNKSNKFLTLLKLGVGAVTGKQQDIGEKGKMDL